MRVKLLPIILLAAIILETAACGFRPLVSVSGTTHLEGEIVEDTVWTLTDSPFVVVKDVIVKPTANLTVEPGVEVKFGGNFTLTIEGTLHAEGTEKNPITITSNKLQPEPGDWNAIRFVGYNHSSLSHCLIEYARDGLEIENGNVAISDCEISNNLQNGIYANQNNDATIIRSRVFNNGNGIFIDGTSSGLNITENRIYQNSEKGIWLNANGTTQIYETLILNNSVASNPVGISVCGNAQVNITRNSIAYNDLGFSYENARDVVLTRYNDIYGNNDSAKAVFSDPIDAEYNFWGDKTGPWHISLNPLGNGDKISSNGIDLDFIPFLTASNNEVNEPPIPYLLTDKTTVSQNDEVTFIGTLSKDDKQVYRYYFDFGDNHSSDWTTLSIFKHKYDSTSSLQYKAELIVMDDFGVTSNRSDSVTISVRNLSPLRANIVVIPDSAECGEPVSITVQVTDEYGDPARASVVLVPITDDPQPIPGITSPSGLFTFTYTAPNLAQSTNILIIVRAYDDTHTDGSDCKYLQVMPSLSVQIATDPSTIRSGDPVYVKVRVTFEGLHIEGAYVNASLSANWSLASRTGITGENGDAILAFTAPLTLNRLDATVKATAEKNGYASGAAQIQTAVEPKVLDVYAKAEPDFVGFGETSQIKVNVTYQGEPVSNARVTLSLNGGGDYDPKTGVTDQNGNATFTFVANGVLTQKELTITAIATKEWYNPGSTQVLMTVEPRTSDIYIVQDTVWTQVDSPLVIVRNVFVEPNATLVIEPGVEVRFGGNFSLTIRGKLYAQGTEEKPIKFTSNKLQPASGDWNTILLTGAETSLLEHCFIEYALNGLSSDNAKAIIANCTIVNNLQSGIDITSQNNIQLKENTIAFNLDGISIHQGTSGVTIERNRIFYNSQCGILLEANATSQILNILVFNNTLSTNNVGIQVKGPVKANITGNSIAYNYVGIECENATNIESPRHNDIYNNAKGMDVSASDPINVENNYWGDESGPYHLSLNPLGKGNAIGGNGVDLVFIPFSTSSSSRINQPPIADLVADKTSISTNQVVIFIATKSADDGRVNWYYLDFGDGKSSGWTTLSVFQHKYDAEGNYSATLVVIDDFGVASNNTMMIPLNVRIDLAPLVVHLVASKSAVARGEQIPLTIQVTSEEGPIGNAVVTLTAVSKGSILPLSGVTDGAGYFRAVYVAPDVTQIVNVKIVATASKGGYIDGSDYQDLQVLPPLTVGLTSEPSTVKSGEHATITVTVVYAEEPVPDADVAVDFNVGGTHSTWSAITGENGSVSLRFNALEIPAPLNAVVKATVSKSGYIDGEAQLQLPVQLKAFDANVTAEPDIVVSEENANVTIRSSYDDAPLENVNVAISSSGGGGFSSSTNLTDAGGKVIFDFKAPLGSEQTNLTISAMLTKLGYEPRNCTVIVTIKPGVVAVTVTANPSSVEAGSSANVSVYVTYNGKPVSGAIVSVGSANGSFYETLGLTRTDGISTFIFMAPESTAEFSTIISANVTKGLFIKGENSTVMTVSPKAVENHEGGFPMMTVLLIVIPIVVVAIVVVLIKKGIIVVSSEEKGWSA